MKFALIYIVKVSVMMLLSDLFVSSRCFRHRLGCDTWVLHMVFSHHGLVFEVPWCSKLWVTLVWSRSKLKIRGTILTVLENLYTPMNSHITTCSFLVFFFI
ncbi:hypothetical protein Hanom_Chr12g01143401 [Helianthus anomalus]